MPTFFVFVFFSFCSGMKRCALLFKIKKKKKANSRVGKEGLQKKEMQTC